MARTVLDGKLPAGGLPQDPNYFNWSHVVPLKREDVQAATIADWWVLKDATAVHTAACGAAWRYLVQPMHVAMDDVRIVRDMLFFHTD